MKLVLVVDDEYALVKALAALLSDEGYAVLSAADGTEALLKIKEHRPDVLLVDWMMSGMDGIELARQLRASADLATIPLIMMSAAPISATAMREGAAAFLRKPFDLALLLATLRRVGAANVP